MKNIDIKAVAVGVLVNILVPLFVITLVITLIGMLLIGEGLRGATLVQKMKIYNHSTPVLAFYMVFGLFADLYSGLITGKLAKDSKIINAGFVGVISLFIALAIPTSTHSSFPAWFHWTGILATIPAALLGGIFSIKYQNSSFLSFDLKNKLWVFEFVIIYCFFKAFMLMGWLYFTKSDLFISVIESLLCIIIAIGLIQKINLARITLITWLVIELIFNIPYRLAHFGKFQLSAVVALALYILIRLFVIYYLRREPIRLKFKRDLPMEVSDEG